MRVIVTRVQPQAARWVELLAQHGHEALALPLIEVAALPDTSAVVDAWQHWAEYTAVMFVSGHAVNYFYASKQALAHIEYAQSAIKTRAWSTGPTTHAALLQQGVAASLIDSPPSAAGQFDSETLWQCVRSQVQPGARVLIVRGDTAESEQPASAGGIPGVGRDWLAQQLESVGAEVNFVVAYQRSAPVWAADQLALATASGADGSVWLFSSAEALDNLHRLLADQNWAGVRAIATHARIAAAARALGLSLVVQAAPTLPSVLASIESLA